VDPFLKKEWYDIKAPHMFEKRTCGKTLVTRSAGTRLASDSLKGRVVEMSLGDLKTNDNDSAFRKFKLQVEVVQGKHCLTNFYGMNLTRDKLCSLVKKWQSTIEANADVKTTDGYMLRVFVIGFTKKRLNQNKKHTYAQSTQIRNIRRKMVEIISRECSVELREVVNKLIPDSIGRDIEKAAGVIFPLHDVCVRKVKVLRKPKTELARILELHGESVGSAQADAGEKVERPDGYEPPVVKEV
jgi:small subunit ribosomal protein S3Ae